MAGLHFESMADMPEGMRRLVAGKFLAEIMKKLDQEEAAGKAQLPTGGKRMKVPKEIAERAKVYQEAIQTATEAGKDVIAWLNEHTEADGVFIENLFITDKPTGKEQGYGEYCDQHSVGCYSDSFAGKYYHPIEGSNLYLGYEYSC